MVARRSTLPDEVHGARAAGALLAGDLDDAVDALAPASNGYLVRFHMRLAMVAPTMSIRLALRIVRTRMTARSSRVPPR